MPDFIRAIKGIYTTSPLYTVNVEFFCSSYVYFTVQPLVRIFKPGARRPHACARFLEITFVPPKYVCVYVCVCVHPRGYK